MSLPSLQSHVVMDSLSQLSMVILAHVEVEKKELVHDVHIFSRLGAQVVDSIKGGVTVHNASESSYVMDGKSKNNLDPILLKLKE